MIFDEHPAVQAAFLSSILGDDEADQLSASADFDGDVRATGDGMDTTLPYPVTLDDRAADLDDDGY